jgi:molybdopterin molybdotransferase
LTFNIILLEDLQLNNTLMISPQDAFQCVVEACTGLSSRQTPLAEAVGLQLMEDIAADRDFPPFHRAMMDGFAVRLTDAGKTLPVAGEIPAGFEWTRSWPQGTCLEIMTGAACPPGVEAVVPKEHVEREGDRIVLPQQIAPGENIVSQGKECMAGRIVLSTGQTLTPLAIAVAAAVGRTQVRAIPRPRLAIVVTGEELAHESEITQGANIHDSNGPMLVALARASGLTAAELVCVGDKQEAISGALERFADWDLVVLSGGVSAGNYDLVPCTVQSWGGKTLFHYVRQKPGKPLFFARRKKQLIFGLPGNPLACHFCFERYVAAALDVLQRKNPHAREFTGTLNATFRAKGERTHFVPARCTSSDTTPGPWQVTPMPGVSSADIFSCTTANCFLEVPPQQEFWPVGSALPCHWFVK